MSPKPARLTWMLAAGAAVVLAGAVAAWPEFLTAQHLDRLRRDPALLGGLLETGSPAELAALRRFVRDRAGREEMLRIYLGGAGEYLHLDYRLLRGEGAAILEAAALEPRELGYAYRGPYGVLRFPGEDPGGAAPRIPVP